MLSHKCPTYLPLGNDILSSVSNVLFCQDVSSVRNILNVGMVKVVTADCVKNYFVLEGFIEILCEMALFLHLFMYVCIYISTFILCTISF